MRPYWAASSTAFVLALATASASVAAPARAQFAIPAGLPLDRALTAFSVQSDRDILFAPGVVAGLRGRAVHGRLAPGAALDELLEGSGLAWREFEGRFLIERAPPKPPTPVVEAASEVEGVVVTALRRPTLERLTPMSMRALSGEELTRAGAATFQQAGALLPGLTRANTGTGRHRFSLRGVYGSGEATTALYYDDVPVTGPSGTTSDPGGSAPELLLVDVDRLELLRGPQGTLYGASAMGGALKVVFHRPNLSQTQLSFSGEVMANAGDWGEAQTLVLNRPLVDDKVGLRLTAYRRSEPAYVDNRRLGLERVNASLVEGARIGLGLRFTPDVEVNLVLAHQESREDDTSGGAQAAPPDVSLNYVRTPFDSRLTFIDGALAWRFSGLQLSANLAGYSWKSVRRSDYTGTLLSERRSPDGCRRYLQIAGCSPAELDLYSAYVDSRAPGLLSQPIDLRAYVQEVRLGSDAPGFVAWTLGAFHELRTDTIDSQVLAADPATGQPEEGKGFTGRRIVDSRLTQRALYGEATLGADRDTSLTLGVRRFEYDKRTLGEALVVNVISNTADANFRTTAGEEGWSVKVLASHRFGPGMMGYAQASQGFRPGGNNTVPNLPPNLASYGADSLWNYELGFKGGWFDNRLLASAAVYRIDWSDMQYTANSTNGAFSFITNLGRARVYGMEAETTFILSPQLRGGANLSLTDAVLTKDQASNDGIGLGAAGDRMPVVPRVAGDGWVEYRRETPWGAELMLRADASYVGTSHSTFKGGSAGDQKLGGMWLFNARAVLKARNWSLGVFGENLTDADRPTFANTVRPPQVFAPRPRRVGLSVAYSF